MLHLIRAIWYYMPRYCEMYKALQGLLEWSVANALQHCSSCETDTGHWPDEDRPFNWGAIAPESSSQSWKSKQKCNWGRSENQGKIRWKGFGCHIWHWEVKCSHEGGLCNGSRWRIPDHWIWWKPSGSYSQSYCWKAEIHTTWYCHSW